MKLDLLEKLLEETIEAVNSGLSPLYHITQVEQGMFDGRRGVYFLYEAELGPVYEGFSQTDFKPRVLKYGREVFRSPDQPVKYPHSAGKRHREENADKCNLFFRYYDPYDDNSFLKLPCFVQVNLDSIIAGACKENMRINGREDNIYNTQFFHRETAKKLHNCVGNIVDGINFSMLPIEG